MPSLVNILYVHHAADSLSNTVSEPDTQQAGEFLREFFGLRRDSRLATCPSDLLFTRDESPHLLVLALNEAGEKDSRLLSEVVAQFPQAAVIALVSSRASEGSDSIDDWLSRSGAAHVIRYDELRVDLFRHVVRQVLKFRRREIELTASSAYSKPTGLFSGGLFLNLTKREIAAALRSNTRLGVFCIRPAQSASVRAETITNLARRLREVVRTEDLLAQAGSSSVLLLQTEVQDPAQCLAFADRLHRAMEPTGSVHIGIACAPDSSLRALDLIRAAKHAAKDLPDHDSGTRLHHAGHKTQVYLHPRVLGDETDLQKIWQRGELAVHYQPIVSRSRLTVAGFECLLRWHHPTRGLLTAAEFLNPSSPAMVPIGNWLLHQACDALREWQQLGWQHLNVAVNIGMAELCHPRFSTVIEEAINQHGLSFQQLVLEIRAENLSVTAIDDRWGRGAGAAGPADPAALTDIREVLEQLDLRGVRIAFDNVGAGGSTTELLRRFPASMLKLDPGVISQLGHDAVAAAVVHGTAGIANSLALSLVAEGVENSSQLKQLLSAGVTLLQGNYLHAPMSRHGVTAWLSAQPRSRQRVACVENSTGLAW